MTMNSYDEGWDNTHRFFLVNEWFYADNSNRVRIQLLTIAMLPAHELLFVQTCAQHGRTYMVPLRKMECW